jgi:hypothetical protein
MDKQDLIERLLNAGVISEYEAEELSELDEATVAAIFAELGGGL